MLRSLNTSTTQRSLTSPGNGHGTIRGSEVDGLTVRDCVLVTDRDEAEGDVTPACVQE